MKIAKTTVDALLPPTRGQALYYDNALKGFGVRITAGGVRSYILEYRKDGRRRRITLGRHGPLTPHRAREKALAALAALAEGEDPRRPSASATIADLADRYLREHARPHKRPASVQGDETILRLHLLPALGRRRVADLGREDAEALLRRLARTPVQANRALALLSKMCSLAETWGLRPGGTNPCRGVRRYREEPRQRWLSPEEMRALVRALESRRDAAATPASRSARDAILFLAFTGCRLREALNLRWEDLDLARGFARIPRAKAGPRVAFLPAPARAILERRRAESRGPWVFPGRSPDRPVREVKGAWAEALRDAGIAPARRHDLRHTFGAAMIDARASERIVAGQLGHRDPKTTRRYAHLADGALRRAVEEAGAALGGDALGEGREAAGEAEIEGDPTGRP